MANSAELNKHGGEHYKCDAAGVCPHCGGTVEHWDWAGRLPGLEYAATKYIARWREKAGLKDLYKARHHLDKLIAWAEKHWEGETHIRLAVGAVQLLSTLCQCGNPKREPRDSNICLNCNKPIALWCVCSKPVPHVPDTAAMQAMCQQCCRPINNQSYAGLSAKSVPGSFIYGKCPPSLG